MKIIIKALFICLIFSSLCFAQSPKELARSLKADYRGKIVAVEQLNSSTCWVVLSPSLSNEECRKLSESIGFYIRNATGGIRGDKPSVHVFKSGKHIATARPDGMNYVGKIDIKNWNPSQYNGKYRP